MIRERWARWRRRWRRADKRQLAKATLDGVFDLSCVALLGCAIGYVWTLDPTWAQGMGTAALMLLASHRVLRGLRPPRRPVPADTTVDEASLHDG